MLQMMRPHTRIKGVLAEDEKSISGEQRCRFFEMAEDDLAKYV
jgi:hypothetical protein